MAYARAAAESDNAALVDSRPLQKRMLAMPADATGPVIDVAAPSVTVNTPVSVKAYPSRSTETIERDDNREMTRVVRDNED